MKATLINKYNSEIAECDLLIVTVSGNATVHISPESVLVFIDGFQFAQYMLTDPKPNTKVLKFKAETERYSPKQGTKKMSVLPPVVFFNAVADNIINFWRGLLK